MESKKTSIVIDQGNTRTKFGIFEDEKIITTGILREWNDSSWRELIQKYEPKKGLFSSVLSDLPSFLVKSDIPIHHLTHSSKFPFKSQYLTMNTLGVDRIANVTAVVSYYKYPALIVDIGSCITYEFIDNNGDFIGGAISPGLNLRLKAMHHFTGKLPLLDLEMMPKKINPIGKTTNESMFSGVHEGIKGEIERYVNILNDLEKDLTIFLTGGDASFFDLVLKNDIFALPNLTLMGMNKILDLNVED